VESELLLELDMWVRLVQTPLFQALQEQVVVAADPT
jgi:hypothetical protein